MVAQAILFGRDLLATLTFRDASERLQLAGYSPTCLFTSCEMSHSTRDAALSRRQPKSPHKATSLLSCENKQPPSTNGWS